MNITDRRTTSEEMKELCRELNRARRAAEDSAANGEDNPDANQRLQDARENFEGALGFFYPASE